MDIKINAKFIPVNQETEQEKWLQLRTTGIGGSDVGAILGMNKYSSPLSVYMQKKGVDGFKGNEATSWGHILEDPIRKKMSEELGIEVATVPGMYTSYDYPFMNANLDGVCHVASAKVIGGVEVEGIGGVEIKTSANGDGFSDDEIPDSYYCQVQHYMAVTNLPFFILTVFILSTKKARHYVIKRNDDFIYNTLIPAEQDFWNNYVLADVVPEPNGVENEKEYLKNLPIATEIVLDEETESVIEEERKLDEQIKDLSKQQDILKNKIILNLYRLSGNSENSEKVIAESDKFKITYNTQRSKRVDTDLLKKSGLFDQYAKESVSKVLRIAEKK